MSFKELEALMLAYRQELPSKADEIANALNLILDQLPSGVPSTQWKELEILLHKLSGSSGTYGLKDLHLVCTHLETLINKNYLQAIPPDKIALYLKTWRDGFMALISCASENVAPKDSSEQLLARLKQVA